MGRGKLELAACCYGNKIPVPLFITPDKKVLQVVLFLYKAHMIRALFYKKNKNKNVLSPQGLENQM